MLMKLRWLVLLLAIAGLLLGVAGYDKLRDMPWEIALSKVYNKNTTTSPGSYVHKFGFNDDIDTTTDPEDLWYCASVGGTTTINFPATAESWNISSDNAGDTHEYTVVGLDADWAEQTQTVTTAGVTFTAIPGTWRRINRAYNSSDTAALGDVFIHTDTVDTGSDGIPDTDTQFRACLQSGKEQTQLGHYSVPAGKHGQLMKYCFVTSSTQATAEQLFFNLLIREDGGVFRTRDQWGGNSLGAGTHCVEPTFPSWLPPKTDINIRVISTATNDAQAAANFDILLWND